jgi:hypothetical protein
VSPAEGPPPALRCRLPLAGPGPLAVVGFLLLLGLGAWQAQGTWAVLASDPRLPLWDMAGHGFQAVQLAVDLAELRPLEFLLHLNAQDKWPFGYSLLLLPFVWVGGASFASAAVPSLVLYALMPALLAWALAEAAATKGSEPGPGGSPAVPGAAWGFGMAAGVGLGLAFLLAPLPRLFSLLVMREMAGMAAVTVALAATLRALRLEGAPGVAPAQLAAAWRWSAGAALLLVLVKMNFGLLWLASLGLWRLLAATAEERRTLRRALLGSWWPRGAGRARWLLAGVLWILALATALGENPGVGVYLTMVGLTVAAAIRWRRDPAAVRTWWSAQSAAARAYLAVFVAPLWVWWLSPEPIHPKEIFAFLRNRPGEPFSWEGLALAYPRSWLADWAPSSVAGLLLAGLAAAAFVAWRRSAGARLVLIALLVHLVLIAGHGYRQPRFLATAVPLVLVAAGIGLGVLAGRRAGPAVGVAAGLALGASLLATPLGGTPAGRETRLRAEWQLHSGSPALAGLLDLARRRAPTAGRLGVIGGFNEMSPALVKWALYQREDRALRFADEPSYPGRRRYGADGSLERLAPPAAASAVADWVAEEEPTAMAVIQVDRRSDFAEDADFRRYNAWQQDLVPAAKGLAGWRRGGRADLQQQGLALLLLVPEQPARQ